LWPHLLGAAQVVQPETILQWHRAGWKAFWRWKSRKRAGRPKIDRGLRDLIQWMSKENPLWGASRIHGELLMLRERHGHPRPTDLAGIAVAKWSCRTPDRHRAPRVPGPDADLRRGAPAANPFFLCCVLQ